MLDQLFGRRAVARKETDADARRYIQLLLRLFERLPEVGKDALRDLARTLRTVDVRQHDGELVPAQARHGVVSRRQPASRAATCLSNVSPMTWPNESLTSLKRSRSMNISAT